MPNKVSASNSLLTGAVGIMRVKATISGSVSEEKSVLFDRIDELANDKSLLLSALKGLSSMYGSTWDSVDGSLVMLSPGIERFEKAHELARQAIAQAEAKEER
ncbi:hypothetical protein [Pseudomonas sp.]|uniref:hypothetical protein n=1 Tax=Pseudomonas sp. TaxID=306 RepID=UPI003D6DAF13